MKPALLGLAIPTITASAAAVERTAVSVTKPFATVLHAAADLLEGSTQSGSLSIESPTKSGSELDPHVELVNLADIREHADDLQNGLEQRLGKLLSDLGIDLNEPAKLRISRADGHLEVEGDISQRAVLEAALAQDPKLVADFRHLAAMRQLLTAADEQQALDGGSPQASLMEIAERAELLGKPFHAELNSSGTGHEVRLEFRDVFQ